MVMAGLVLGACATEDTTPATSGALAQGVTVLEAGEGSLSLAVRDGDDVLYMQALRGRPTPYQDEPNMPAWEIDARFLSEHGATFYSRQGGDQLIDQRWADALDRQTASPASRESNERLFVIAGGAADLIEAAVATQLGAERAAELAPEIEALRESAAAMPRLYEESRAHRAEYQRDHLGVPTVPGEGGDVVYGTEGAEDAELGLAANYYYIAVHKECIFLCAGDHSATQLHEWLGYWAHVHDFCNHGSCAGRMDRSGLLQYYEAIQDYHPAWTAQTCDTHYDWDSSGGGHNCHDDSRLQMNDFVYGRAIGGAQYWCNDSSTDKWKAPSANGDDDEGYNHPDYCDYDFGGASSCPSSYQGTNDGCDCGCLFPDGTHADPDCHP